MTTVDLQNIEEARLYLLQGLWLERVARPHANLVRPILEWALAVSDRGDPLPPLGTIADFGHIAFGFDPSLASQEQPIIPGWPSKLSSNYEDYLLGKLYADWTFERATDALRRYDTKERAKGLAFVLKQFRDRADLGGVELSTSVIRGLLNVNPADLLAEGYESFHREGPHPVLVRQYEELTSVARKMAEVLSPEDVIALEQRTALADMSRFVAHRQILTFTAKLEALLPTRPVRPLIGRKEVPTRVLDEDQYPVGGYTSISNRGSIESLLHSQLAYMETDAKQSPDLFDIKFARDELFYYSRDENQFLRRRRAFVFVVVPDMLATRFKDAELPCQRIVLACSTILALVRRLSDWLSFDALRFELHFVKQGEKQPLAQEMELFQILLRELIDTEIATVQATDSVEQVAARCSQLSRNSQVQILQLTATASQFPEPEGTVLSTLVIQGPQPKLLDGFGKNVDLDADDASDAWTHGVLRVLELWI